MSEAQTRHNLELRGSITTVTPFANSPAGCKIESGADKGLQKLPRMPVITPNGGAIDTPFISASAIRGVLRRAAAEEVAELFAARGEEVRFPDWLLFSVGGVKGTEKETCSPRERHEYIEGNPLVALFGAGAAGAGGMIGSKLHIAHAIPDSEIKPPKVEGARAHEDKSLRLLEILPEDQQALAWDFTVANRDRSELSGQVKSKERELRAARNARKKEDNAKAEALSAELDDLKERLRKAVDIQEQFGTSNAIGRPLPGYEVIPSGAEIPHRMSLDAASLSQVGLFFAALRRFARDPVIGAHRAHGCGRIRCDYKVIQREGESIRRLGTLKIGEREDIPESAEEWQNFQITGEALTELEERAAGWRESADPKKFRPRKDADK